MNTLNGAMALFIGSFVPVSWSIACATLFVLGLFLLALGVRSNFSPKRRFHLRILGIAAMALGIAACAAAALQVKP